MLSFFRETFFSPSMYDEALVHAAQITFWLIYNIIFACNANDPQALAKNHRSDPPR
jgi:hypothetical protein